MTMSYCLGQLWSSEEGRPRNVLLSYAVYEKLIGDDIQAFPAAHTLDELLDDFTAQGASTFHHNGPA